MAKRRGGILNILWVFPVMVLFAGCATKTYTFDKETPTAAQATIRIVNAELKVVSFDENPVKWKGKKLSAISLAMGKKMETAGNGATFPAGPHTLTVNYEQGNFLFALFGPFALSSTAAFAMHISQNFEPGKTYMLTSNKPDMFTKRVNLSITEIPGGAK